jgi:hypothetical protein
MQHTTEADETFKTYSCNMCVKHMQHHDKTLANCNMKTLIGVKHMQYPDKKCLQHTSEIDETF